MDQRSRWVLNMVCIKGKSAHLWQFMHAWDWMCRCLSQLLPFVARRLERSWFVISRDGIAHSGTLGRVEESAISTPLVVWGPTEASHRRATLRTWTLTAQRSLTTCSL